MSSNIESVVDTEHNYLKKKYIFVARIWNNSNKVRELCLISMDLFSISNFICSISDFSGILKLILCTVIFVLSGFAFLTGACSLAGLNMLRFLSFPDFDNFFNALSQWAHLLLTDKETEKD